MNEPTVKAVNLLNGLLDTDPALVSTLLSVNFTCNNTTADTDIEVFAVGDARMTNFIGLLNALLDDKIAIVYGDNGSIEGFTVRHK